MSSPLGAGATASPFVSPDAVQRAVDAAAHFNMYSLPAGTRSSSIFMGGARTIVGWDIEEQLHRFLVTVAGPTPSKPLRAKNQIAERAGSFVHRWLLIPDDYAAAPDSNPPATAFDPSRPQRFMMKDSVCRFRNGIDGFRSFGTGQTVPDPDSSSVFAMAVGTLLDGFGKFSGISEGTFCYCGKLHPDRGFVGNLLLRIMDRHDVFHTETALPAPEAVSEVDEDATYLLFRGQAVPDDPVSPNIGPGGQPIGLVVEQGLRLVDVDFAASATGGMKSTAAVGPNLGKITARVVFNPATPGGGPLQPIPFTADDEFAWRKSEKGRIGSFNANSEEGRVFATNVAGLPAIRFGGIGKILSGQSPFAGMQGLMTDNSVVVFDPHVSASLYMLRVHDPNGRYRMVQEDTRRVKRFTAECYAR